MGILCWLAERGQARHPNVSWLAPNALAQPLGALQPPLSKATSSPTATEEAVKVCLVTDGAPTGSGGPKSLPVKNSFVSAAVLEVAPKCQGHSGQHVAVDWQTASRFRTKEELAPHPLVDVDGWSSFAGLENKRRQNGCRRARTKGPRWPPQPAIVAESWATLDHLTCLADLCFKLQQGIVPKGLCLQKATREDGTHAWHTWASEAQLEPSAELSTTGCANSMAFALLRLQRGRARVPQERAGQWGW